MVVVIPAAMIKMSKGPANGENYQDDVDWNDESTLRDAAYLYSKVNCGYTVDSHQMACATHMCPDLLVVDLDRLELPAPSLISLMLLD